VAHDLHVIAWSIKSATIDQKEKEVIMFGMNKAHIDTVYQREDDMSDLMRRCRMALDMGASKEEVHDICIQAGQSEEQAYLTYIAAKLLTRDEACETGARKVA